MGVRLLFVFAVALMVSTPALAVGSGLRDFLGALAEIGRRANQANRTADIPQLLLFGGVDHKDFLGCLNCGELSTASVANSLSQYGFTNNLGVWSSLGQYAGRFSSYSACNAFATDPPVIVDRAGNFYGRFTINRFAPAGVCSVTGNAQACQIVNAVCALKN